MKLHIVIAEASLDGVKGETTEEQRRRVVGLQKAEKARRRGREVFVGQVWNRPALNPRVQASGLQRCNANAKQSFVSTLFFILQKFLEYQLRSVICERRRSASFFNGKLRG